MIENQAMVIGNWGLQDVRGHPEGHGIHAGNMGLAGMLKY